MKKFLFILGILILNSNISLAANNLVNVEWWKTTTLDEVKSEIAKGADVNIGGNDKAGNGDLRTNVTPLMFALKYNNPSVEVIEMLINAGADVNAKENTIGLTPLIYAVEHSENPKIIQALLQAGANVNSKTNVGNTALTEAAQWNSNPEIIKILINAGADVNAKDKDGRTALMYILRNENLLEVARTLIDAGADKNVFINGMSINILFAAIAGSDKPKIKEFASQELERLYKKESYEDRADFEATFEGCLASEEFQQNFEDSLPVEMKLEKQLGAMFNPLVAASQETQRSRDCQCIFDVAEGYLGETEFKNIMTAFNQGRRGSSKKALKKAIPVAFAQCF